MRNLILAVILMVVGLCALAQRPSSSPSQQMAPRANQGHLPPPPSRRVPNPGGEQLGNGRINSTPHVNHDQWYGHDSPNDSRYHLERPFVRGHFEHSGPGFRYRFLRVDRTRHWFWFPGGFYFEVASWDWPVFVDWCWDCGDDFVVYEDPDHIGWYLLYNIHTGAYVHVQYMGM